MEDRELTFWEHLDVLRWALARIVGLWFVLAIGFFIAMPYIFDPVIMGPCHDNFVFYGFLRKIGEVFNLTGDFFTQRFDIKLQNINLAAPFFVHLTTSFVLSIIILVPYIFWEIWLFIRPALYPNEAAGVRKALLLGNVMFYIGMAVGYFMVYPLALRFLSTYDLSENIDTLISLNSYIDNFMMLVLAMGIAFELPLVTWLLSLFGLITRSTLREYRRHAIVVIVIAAAIITPTGDPFTLTAVALPLYALYELSILMIKEEKDEDDADADDTSDGGSDGGDEPDGPAPALEKKPDGGGDPDAPDAEAKQVKPEDKDIHDTFRKQREAAAQAKIEEKNKALQERLDKAAAATGVAGAAAATADASDGTTKELTANTDSSVKDALAEAKEATPVKKKKREPRMVIINDEIYWEEGPEIDDDEEEMPEEKQKEEELPASEEEKSGETTAEESKAGETPTEETPTAGTSTEETVTGEASSEVADDETPVDSSTAESSEEVATSETSAADETLAEHQSETMESAAESSLEEPYVQETVNQPEALQTPYYDDPEAMPDLSNYYAENQRQIAEEEAAEVLKNTPTDVASLADAIPSSPSVPLSSSTNDIVEQARMAAENARKAAEQAVKAAQEAARIAEETAKAAEEAAKQAAEQAAKVAAEAASPAIDVSGIRYDYGRFNQ
ncbi:MAG: twin-arginine translocase subunit TatC [Bacteroidaceae bacterium]|nr:twin-arginine translocase subunit TatC [Bacteroidaceae bacterium]